ncbi:MAG: NAD(P)/FAD-dependent oxidoreductase [Bacteroidota bacterium]
MNTDYDILIIGGGAAGFFTAINAAEMNPAKRIALLERGKDVLTKVKISGGGRCNVTHAQYDPRALSKNYPRGEKELLGPFHNFMTGDTVAWFENRGVPLKTESDGRMFPASNSSQSIIDCFMAEAERLSIDVLLNNSVKNISNDGEVWKVKTAHGMMETSVLVVATGSNPKIWKLMEHLGHTIVPPVPSLFTFNIKDTRIADLPGVSTPASIKVLNEKEKVELESEGPLLITHWGMSGPAILKLSAWGARILAPRAYRFTIIVNWIPELSAVEVLEMLMGNKSEFSKQTVLKHAHFGLPKRLWRNMVMAVGISANETWAEIAKKKLQNLAQQLTASYFEVNGKSTFKEEFVTAGGIDLKEINFKTFESKKYTGLYFAGEVLNIDAITGGFNFQNAWTGAFMVAQAIAK